MYRDFQRPFALSPGETELIIVRHGATVDQTFDTPITGRQSDPGLKPEGARQAEALAARLAGERLGGLFVTPLRRTADTAAPLAAVTRLAPVVMPELREIELGDWEGGEFQRRVDARDPVIDLLYREQRWDVLPGAEAMPQFVARVHAGLERVVALTGAGRSAVVIAHGAVIAEACRRATGSRPLAFLGVENGAISRIVTDDGGTWFLRGFNDTNHLAGLADMDTRSGS